MEALKLPKASKDCIAEESNGDEKIVVGENIFSIIQNPLPSNCKDLDFLEAEFLQDECPTLSIEEQAELEAFSKDELFNTQGLSDEKIDAAIMSWCMKRKYMSSAESCKLPNPDDLTSQSKLPIQKTKKELLLSVIQPPNSALPPPPVSMKHAYLKENDTLPVIISSDSKRSQEEELMRMLKRHRITIGWALTEIMGISLVVCMRYISLEEGVKPQGVP